VEPEEPTWKSAPTISGRAHDSQRGSRSWTNS